MCKEEILQYLREHKEEFYKEYGVTKIGLFGSFARDEANDSSDIDIAIEANKHSFFIRHKLKEILQSDLNKSVDIGYFNSFRTLIKKEVQKDIIYV